MDQTCFYSTCQNFFIRVKSGEFGSQVNLLTLLCSLNHSWSMFGFVCGRVYYAAERGLLDQVVFFWWRYTWSTMFREVVHVRVTPHSWFSSKALHKASHCLWQLFFTWCILVPSLAQVSDVHTWGYSCVVKENSINQTRPHSFIVLCSCSDAYVPIVGTFGL